MPGVRVDQIRPRKISILIDFFVTPAIPCFVILMICSLISYLFRSISPVLRCFLVSFLITVCQIASAFLIFNCLSTVFFFLFALFSISSLLPFFLSFNFWFSNPITEIFSKTKKDKLQSPFLFPTGDDRRVFDSS